MNRTDAPTKQPKPFGVNGQREDILPTTPAGDNTASYESGFPPITMILKSAGGKPPKGQDMNQILYELSALGRWSSAGCLNTFDSAFASDIAGYPQGAYVLGDDLKTVYRCTINGNTADPNSVTTGWVKEAQDIADILALGTAAYKTVGTGTGQIPDMSSFPLSAGSPTTPGYSQLPNGLMIQWGTIAASANDVTTSFPVLFPTQIIQIFATSGYTPGVGTTGVSSIGTAINTSVRGSFISRNTSPTLGGRYLAIGN